MSVTTAPTCTNFAEHLLDRSYEASKDGRLREAYERRWPIAAFRPARLGSLDRAPGQSLSLPRGSFEREGRSRVSMAVELHITRKGETTCVALLGEFEPAGVEELRARLGSVQQDQARPVLDLRRVVVDSPPSGTDTAIRKRQASEHLDPSA